MIRFIDTEDYANVVSGIATSVWFQGCEARCRGCHNPELIPFFCAEPVAVETAKREILLKSYRNATVSFLGGEPLLHREELLSLLLYSKSIGLMTALWTGFELADVDQEILNLLDYIKVGRYERSKKIKGTYYGSSNQRMYRVVDGHIESEIQEMNM